MKLTAVLFDLDGTLLPMDNDEFTKGYFRLLAAKLSPYGYDPKELVAGVWKGTGAMVKNDGSRSNHDAFWETFAAVLGDRVYSHEAVFDEFYSSEFNRAKDICGFNDASARIVSDLKARGLRVVLASNPIFPMEAQKARIRWAGIDPSAFELITAYENYSCCKPSPAYYTAVAEQLGIPAGECLMVGNDTDEDVAAASAAGMRVFLLTDCMINRSGADISSVPHGGFAELEEYLRGL